jgi:hypothetical protein
MGVNDESEIDWKLLSDEDWNLWSAHQLQRRFKYLLNAIDGHDKMQYPGMSDIELLRSLQRSYCCRNFRDSQSEARRYASSGEECSKTVRTAAEYLEGVCRG